MKNETCQNCGCTIGKLESAYVFNGNVVCQNCYQKLTDTEDKQVQTAIKKPIEVKVEPVPPQTAQENSKHKVTKWYFSTSAVVIALLCLGLLALPLVWFHPRYKIITKFIVTVIVTVIVIVFATLSPYLVSYIPQNFYPTAKLPAISEKDVKLIEALINEMNLLVELQRADSETFEFQLAKLDAARRNLDNLGSSNYPMAIIRILALSVSIKYDLAHTLWESGRYEEYEKSKNDASQSRENFIEAYRLWQDKATFSEFNKFLKDRGYTKQEEGATSK